MAQTVIEADGYYIRCWAEFDEAMQAFRPMAYFERVSDFASTQVLGMRHAFKVWFATEQETTHVAHEQAIRLIANEAVGL